MCVFLGLAVALILKNCKNGGVVKRHLAFLSGVAPHGGAIGAGITAFGALLVFFSMGAAKTGVAAATDLPLFASSVYTSVAGLIVLVIAFCIGGAYAYRDKLNDKAVLTWLVPACAMLLILFFRLSAIKGATMPYGYAGQPFNWTLPTVALLGGLAVLFLLGSTVPRGLFYAIPVAAVQLSVFVLLRKGGMNGLTHPTSWWFWWGVLWDFAIIGLAWLTLPNGRSVALTTLFAELGVSFYIYMPIVSDLRNPPMNWGYPRTWEGFKHAITRGQYENWHLLMSLPRSSFSSLVPTSPTCVCSSP